MPVLAAKEHCTGCTACASVCPKGCITMMADGNGFLCPVIDAQKCISCGLCEKSCPIISPLEKPVNEPVAYAAYSKDEAMRLRSSSGGVFTEFARAVLNDGGAVFGAAYDAQFEVVHICVENEADLAKLRGAKYAQSDLGDSFRNVKRRLEQGQKVLFSGTPCQVGGLKAFLHKDYENLLAVDFVCLSVPSPMAWREYVKYRAELDNGGKLPEVIDLRSKKTGWSRYQYSNLFQYTNSNAYAVKSGDSLYMKLFGGGYISREACSHCQFKGYSRVSDLTIGDFWGIWDIAPEMDDNKGTSVILVQTPKGAGMLHSLNERMMLKPVTREEASMENRALLITLQPNVRRNEALALIGSGEIAVCESWFPIIPKVEKKVFRNMVKNILRRIQNS